MRFQDRREAGRLLAERLEFLEEREELLVLGIPRGGVVVADEVARALDAPLDVFIARKLRAPHNPELAVGAVASSGEVVLDERLIEDLGVPQSYLEAETERQRAEIQRRMKAYRGGRPALDLKDKTIILTDDGVATGATMRAAIQALEATELRELIVALPVGPPDIIQKLANMVDRMVCLHTPSLFWAVGAFYVDFRQTTDAEVIQLLQG
ncbi:MAG: phosphoribosyltransferase [Chloroflexota bacterium]|nr:phosphoribosyltransferase [Chloroflexota bacterium]